MSIAYCIKKIDGSCSEGTVLAEVQLFQSGCGGFPDLDRAMEATIFNGWSMISEASCCGLKVAHPERQNAITASIKKNDQADAEKIADLLRVNLLPECHMLSEELRELRRILRYRNMIVRSAVKMKNKISGLLMETGTTHNKKRLHGKKYFNNLLERIEDVHESVKHLLKLSRSTWRCLRPFRRSWSRPCRTTN
jgi:hypothetical protein